MKATTNVKVEEAANLDAGGTVCSMNRDQPSSRINVSTNPKQDNPRTDWLAWSLQLIFGFVVGFGATFLFRLPRLAVATAPVVAVAGVPSTQPIEK